MRQIALVLAAAVPLAACGDNAARTFGFTREAPDEFRVQTRAPLSIPPDFALRAPRPGAPRPQEADQREQAEAALLGGAALGAAPDRRPASGGEGALLAAAGPAAPADIRDRVTREGDRLNAVDRTIADRLMFWREAPQPGIAVDPQREAQRLRDNAALGREAGQGDTAIIQPRRRGLLEGIF
jgi:hypothetical protein